MISEHPGKALREALRLSQVEFARAIGRSSPFVSQVESGRDAYGPETLCKIADMWRSEMLQLGITVEDFLRWQSARSREAAAEGAA